MVRQSQGYDTNIAISKETTQGTAGSAWKSVGIVKDFEPEINKNHEAIRGLGYRKVLSHKQGIGETTSSLGLYLQNPTILYYALGKVTKTGAANAWIHTITSTGRCEELPTFTVQENICIGGTPLVTNFLGSKVDSLTISGSAGEPVEVSADLIHLKSQDGATAAGSYTVDTNEILTCSDATATINGTVEVNVKEFEVELANNLEALATLNKSTDPTMINEGVLDITGSFTFALTNTAQRTLFRSGASFTVKLRFDDPLVGANYVEINLSGAKYDTDSISASADSELDHELDVLFTDITIVAGSKDIADLTV